MAKTDDNALRRLMVENAEHANTEMSVHIESETPFERAKRIVEQSIITPVDRGFLLMYIETLENYVREADEAF